MKVVIGTLSEKALEENDYQDDLVIKIDGKCVFSVSDGEPEDNNLGRNFNDCHKIPEIIKMVHKAGADDEPLEVEYVDFEDCFDFKNNG